MNQAVQRVKGSLQLHRAIYDHSNFFSFSGYVEMIWSKLFSQEKIRCIQIYFSFFLQNSIRVYKSIDMFCSQLQISLLCLHSISSTFNISNLPLLLFFFLIHTCRLSTMQTGRFGAYSTIPMGNQDGFSVENNTAASQGEREGKRER